MENNTTIKFTPEELKSIKTINERYQQKVLFFGQLALEKIFIEENIKKISDAESKTKDEYLSIQKDEEALLNSLTSKYGEGKLNINDGSFTPSSKK